MLFAVQKDLGSRRADPLRVLRAVRFASRFKFEMTDELKAAASSPEVSCALPAVTHTQQHRDPCLPFVQQVAPDKICRY